jgi:hypothetical protein
MDHFDWPLTKNHDTLIFPKHYHFLPMWDYGGVIPRNILNAHFASHHCLSLTFMNSINLTRIAGTKVNWQLTAGSQSGLVRKWHGFQNRNRNSFI